MSETEEKTHWWTWVQFAFLVCSVIANIYLYFDSERKSDAIQFATYNEKAWEANEEFIKKLNQLNTKTEHKISIEIDRKTLNYENMYEKSISIENEWVEGVHELLAELKSKLESYDSVVDKKLDANGYLARRVAQLGSPSRNTLSYFEGIIKEHSEWVKNNSHSRGGAYVVASTKKLKKYKSQLEGLLKKNKEYLVSQWKA